MILFCFKPIKLATSMIMMLKNRTIYILCLFVPMNVSYLISRIFEQSTQFCFCLPSYVLLNIPTLICFVLHKIIITIIQTSKAKYTKMFIFIRYYLLSFSFLKNSRLVNINILIITNKTHIVRVCGAKRQTRSASIISFKHSSATPKLSIQEKINGKVTIHV